MEEGTGCGEVGITLIRTNNDNSTFLNINTELLVSFAVGTLITLVVDEGLVQVFLLRSHVSSCI